MNVIGEKGIVKYANGFIVKDLDIDEFNIIPEANAISEAINFINAEKYMWEVEYEEENQENKYDYYPNDIANGDIFGNETVNSLGLETVTNIAFITFNWWLWSNVTYPQMAQQTIEATIAHYGRCSIEHKQVVKALRAVNFDIQNPFCYTIDINGPEIIDIINIDNNDIFWTANLNDIDDDQGSYQWHYPNDWQVSIKGNQLTLNDYSSTSSQQLAVTYTDSKNNIYTDTIVVHFSDEDWQMTENNSTQTINNVLKEVNKTNGFIIRPNPASDKITLDIGLVDEMINIEIYDLNGRLINAYNTQDNSYIIDLKHFSNGLYIIKTTIGNKVFKEKLSIIK